jgi:hypothetical protein
MEVYPRFLVATWWKNNPENVLSRLPSCVVIEEGKTKIWIRWSSQELGGRLNQESIEYVFLTVRASSIVSGPKIESQAISTSAEILLQVLPKTLEES